MFSFRKVILLLCTFEILKFQISCHVDFTVYLKLQYYFSSVWVCEKSDCCVSGKLLLHRTFLRST